jgi:formylglycine-generating enzyme required for sulfatase activity
MSGNVFEWCDSWYERDWVGTRTRKVYRGGSFTHPPEYCRSAFRARERPSVPDFFLGVRVALSVPRRS